MKRIDLRVQLNNLKCGRAGSPMNEVSAAMAKLSAIRQSVFSVLIENVSAHRSSGEVLVRSNFAPELVKHYFEQAAKCIDRLRALLPDLYGDFQSVDMDPKTEVVSRDWNTPPPMHFSRPQLERLVRDVDQVFEIRANSELEQPKQADVVLRRVFITHGRAHDWRAVQTYVERDIGLSTMELAQEASQGKTIIEKLFDGASQCDGAIIVMTGDDVVADGTRVRENVMHEIGFFQGKYGRNRVVLLHEEGVVIPTNLAGVVYVPFPKQNIEAGFHVLQRELKTMYGL